MSTREGHIDEAAIDAVVLEAIRQAIPAAQIPDAELHEIACDGLDGAGDGARRDEALRAIARNDDGAAAGAVLHAEWEGESAAKGRRRRWPMLLYRCGQVGFAAAAVFAGAVMLEALTSSPPAPGAFERAAEAHRDVAAAPDSSLPTISLALLAIFAAMLVLTYRHTRRRRRSQ